MAALTANRKRYTRNVHQAKLGSAVGVDSEEFYEGQGVCSNAGEAAAAADTSGFRTLGVSIKRASTGSSNTARIEFEFGHEEWFPQDGNIAAGDVGANAIWLDDNTLTDAGTATNDVEAGRITELETIDGVAGCWIEVAGFSPDNA